MSSRKQQHPKSPSSAANGLQVIGAGLMRTGTNSQMKALEILLGGRCYHMYVIGNERRRDIKLWYKAATEGMTGDLADQIFSDFRACTDLPAALFYRELSEIYPNAKFVLSVRDPKRWVDSVRATIAKKEDATGAILSPVKWLLGTNYFDPLRRNLFDTRLGLRFDMSDDEMARVFDRHTESVVQAIPKERLLVFRVSDGWEPLCKFLELPVPDEPFPNVNDTAEFQQKVRMFRIFGVVANAAFFSVVGCVAWFGLRVCLQKWG